MPLTATPAARALEELARARDADDRLVGHLEAVREAFSAEMAWVERELEEAARNGPEPASTAVAHLVARGGKRIRPLALVLSAACFGRPTRAVRDLAVVVELIHTATLLHDDVIDDGAMRRGAPTARQLWSNAVSVLGGDLALVSALSRANSSAGGLLPSLFETLGRLVEGEIVQLRGRDALDLTEAGYFRVLRLKTASLFAWATRSGAALGGASAASQACMARFGEQLGVAFQLVDDAIDYAGEHTGKTLLADLREGKATLPLILAVRGDSSLDEVVPKARAGDADALEAVRRRVLESGACQEVRRRARRVTDAAVDALHGIPDSSPRAVLEAVAYELVGRGT